MQVAVAATGEQTMIKTLLDFYDWSSRWRKEFGPIDGLRIALALRRAMWAAPSGTLIPLEVPTLRHPLTIRAGTSDAEVFIQVFGEHQAGFPAPGDPAVIIDAGANIGLTAAVFATRFPRARILALEIDPANFALLQQNTGAYSNVVPVAKGLWARRTRIRVKNPAAESWAFQASEATDSGGASIEALGVAELLTDFQLPRIDILKIDIEGGEYEVFTGNVEDWIDRVGMIAVEVHDRFRPGCTEAIRRALSPLGFTESTWSEYLIYVRDIAAGSSRVPLVSPLR